MIRFFFINSSSLQQSLASQVVSCIIEEFILDLLISLEFEVFVEYIYLCNTSIVSV